MPREANISVIELFLMAIYLFLLKHLSLYYIQMSSELLESGMNHIRYD